MSDQPSSGSKLGALAGVVITIAFFLPWVRACNTEVSGYELAAGQTERIQVEDPWQYWLVLVAGLVCVGLFFLVRTGTRDQRIRVAISRLAVGIVGFFPILNVWLNVKQRGETMKILFGGWVTALGFLGVLVSFLMDMGGPTDESE